MITFAQRRRDNTSRCLHWSPTTPFSHYRHCRLRLFIKTRSLEPDTVLWEHRQVEDPFNVTFLCKTDFNPPCNPLHWSSIHLSCLGESRSEIFFPPCEIKRFHYPCLGPYPETLRALTRTIFRGYKDKYSGSHGLFFSLMMQNPC